MTCVVRNCPIGLGSPVFDKLEAELAKAVMSLPATKVPGARNCMSCCAVLCEHWPGLVSQQLFQLSPAVRQDGCMLTPGLHTHAAPAAASELDRHAHAFMLLLRAVGVVGGSGADFCRFQTLDSTRTAHLRLADTQGFEIGSGFSGAAMLGSEHNDEFYMEGGHVRTRTNRSGGVQGGISNGAAVLMLEAHRGILSGCHFPHTQGHLHAKFGFCLPLNAWN